MIKAFDEMDFLEKLIDLLEMQLGNNCEVVLHDLTKSYESTIVDIRNGHITDRKIGECGSSMGLEVLKGTVKNGDKYNYITNTRDGKILRSSTVHIKDKEGKVIGALCINYDITETIRFETYLRQFNNYNPLDNGVETCNELFANNVNELLDFFFVEGQKQVGKSVQLMTKEEKIELLEYLDSKGAFLITKANEKICEFLNISKYTLYHYLDMIRKNN